MDFTVTFITNTLDKVVDVKGSSGYSTALAIIEMYNEFVQGCRADCIMPDPDDCYCDDEVDPDSILTVKGLKGIAKTSVELNVYDKKWIYGIKAFETRGYVTVVCPKGWLNSLVDILIERDFDYNNLVATCVLQSSPILNAWYDAGAPLFWGPDPSEFQRVE